VFTDVGELRVKEVDRLAAVIDLVTAFGGRASADGDTLSITGCDPAGRLHAARFDSRGDHRMAMAAAIAALAVPANQRSLITGFDAVATSYPSFADDLSGLTATAPEAIRPRPLLVAIDGPAGAGKSTVSRAVASHLGVERLDTGAMYRAVAALALRDGVAPDDLVGVARLAADAVIEVDAHTIINGHDVTDVIRSPEVGQAVSLVAANAEVRLELVKRQRAWAAHHGGGVVEGRDIGTVVFPNATLKVYLTASPEERVRRRRDESAAGVARRDHIDSTRAASPLMEAPDAHLLDTTGRDVQDVVEEVLSWL
jgi:cytidylate kinase